MRPRLDHLEPNAFAKPLDYWEDVALGFMEAGRFLSAAKAWDKASVAAPMHRKGDYRHKQSLCSKMGGGRG